MARSPGSEDLTSWKEIANYLRISIRTAQLWERDRGLPIRRLPGPRGLVSAKPSELDDWRNSAPPPETPHQPSHPPPRQSPRWWWAAALLLIVGGLAWIILLRAPDPVYVRLNDDTLIAIGPQGDELWRVNLFASQIALPIEPSRTRLWVGDLDGDGHQEVLYGRRDNEHREKDGLYCYGSNGKLRWTFQPRRTVRTSTTPYPPPYGFHALVVLQHPTRVAVSSYHYPFTPAQVAILDPQGRVLGEYWHFGHLSDLVADSRQGQERLYLGGIDNRKQAATFISLDPRRLTGVTQSGDRPFLDLPAFPGETKFLFPRSEINQAYELYNGVHRIDMLAEGPLVHTSERLRPPVTSSVLYQLDHQLHLLRVGLSDRFVKDQQQLHETGPVHLTPDAEAQRLATAYRQTVHPHARQPDAAPRSEHP